MGFVYMSIPEFRTDDIALLIYSIMIFSPSLILIGLFVHKGSKIIDENHKGLEYQKKLKRMCYKNKLTFDYIAKNIPLTIHHLDRFINLYKENVYLTSVVKEQNKKLAEAKSAKNAFIEKVHLPSILNMSLISVFLSGSLSFFIYGIISNSTQEFLSEFSLVYKLIIYCAFFFPLQASFMFFLYKKHAKDEGLSEKKNEENVGIYNTIKSSIEELRKKEIEYSTLVTMHKLMPSAKLKKEIEKKIINGLEGNE
ncbi:MAG: hypothetical protein ACLFP2_01185 [Candidatus Woesearchaeota archaeon]